MIEGATARLPPTFWTMSAKTVVVATTLMASAAAVGGPPEPAADELAAGPQPLDASIAIAVNTIRGARAAGFVVLRLTLIDGRTSFSMLCSAGGQRGSRGTASSPGSG